MKKLIGILGVAVIAMAMFFNTNTTNNENLDLASLLAISTANAEVTATIDDCDAADPEDVCHGNGHWVGCDDSWFWDTCQIVVCEDCV